MALRILVSFHYHRSTDLADLRDRLGGDVDLFADSGAYSAATTGATVNLADYSAWLTDWAPLWTTMAGLDVIGDHEATAANTAALHQAGHDVLPVFHVGEPWPVLDALCKAHPYVALGGMALHAVGGAKRRPLMAWLVRCFRIGAEHGTRFHGFGMTSAGIVVQLPFYSVDSSSYTLGQRWGLVYLWDDSALKMRSVFFRNPDEVRPYAALFTRHGLDPARVIDPAFMRPGTPSMVADRAAVTTASAYSYRLMEDFLTSRHRVAPPPLLRAADTGTKVYLALSKADASSVDPLLSLVERTPAP
ncbi:hypothetical protein [Streptomyces sp. NPDC057250]|uniref:hypothetical protein n=1 Tax=Streptomyces sp. NPDC057250 TaxID=3346068 RepID=UPI00362C9026